MRFVAYFGNSIACQCLISAFHSAGTAMRSSTYTLRILRELISTEHTRTHKQCEYANASTIFFSLAFLSSRFLCSSWVIVICIYSITILAQCACFFPLWLDLIIYIIRNISPFYQMADGKCETGQMKSEAFRQRKRRNGLCVWHTHIEWANEQARTTQTSRIHDVQRCEMGFTNNVNVR